MARLPVISGDDFVRVMEKAGYVWDHTEGSHMILFILVDEGSLYPDIVS